MLHFGLIGYPLSHSLSAYIHSKILEFTKLSGEYHLIEIPPMDNPISKIDNQLNKIKKGELQGLNVTIPYKRIIIDYLDELNYSARVVGAVNTICFEKDKLKGDNTDAEAFWADLSYFLGNVNNKMQKHALVLGAGGAARAVIYMLIINNWHVWVSTRRIEQANQLINELFTKLSDRESLYRESSLNAMGVYERIKAVSLDRLSKNLELFTTLDLVVNATPVGMFPDTKATPWPEGMQLPQNAYIFDLIYNPVQTRLLQTAHDQGLPARNGLGMLVRQALSAFEKWTGTAVSVEEIQSSLFLDRIV